MKLISVIMPVYNTQSFIADSLISILNQSYPHFELIIIDDASNDKTINVINKFSDHRIKLLKNKKHSGVAKSLNQALKVARGSYIARMDADDIALPERFNIQIQYLTKNPQIVAIGSWVELINHAGKTIGIKKMPVKYQDIKKIILKFNPFIHPTMMIRKLILKNIGNYQERYNGAEDYDLFLHMTAKHQVANLPIQLLKLRIYDKSVTAKRMKIIEYQSLRVRINALLKYDYSWWQSIYLLKPLLSYLVPARIKQTIFYS